MQMRCCTVRSKEKKEKEQVPCYWQAKYEELRYDLFQKEADLITYKAITFFVALFLILSSLVILNIEYWHY
jgi:hypothetical protein